MPDLVSHLHRLRAWVQLSRYDRSAVFTKIFKERAWGDEESVSGIGSRSAQTENIRRELPRIFERFSIRSVFDAPCGDFAWMKHVVADTQVEYLGGDIVEDVIEVARQNAGDLEAEFKVHDIVVDPLPAMDLWLCRDCLFHLSYKDIFASLRNFLASECKYILTTTHISPLVRNRNIVNGDFRAIDLFAPPFSFPREPLYEFDDFAPPAHPRKMIMLERAQLARTADSWPKRA